MLGSAKSSSLARQIDRLQAEVSDLGDQLSRYSTKKHARKLARRAGDHISARYDDYSQQLSEFGDAAGEHLHRAGKHLEGEVRFHPFRALLVAALVGVAVGALSRAR